MFRSRVNQIFLVNETWLARHGTSHLVLEQGLLRNVLQYIFYLCYNKMMTNFECVDDNINLKKTLDIEIV